MYIAPTLELKTSNLLGCPHNNQSSKLDQEGGNGPKEFWCLSSNFVPGVQFPPNFSGLSSCLVGWVASCVVLYNPPPAVVPAWLESQVWTLGPNSNTWFLSDIFRPLFTCFWPLLPPVVDPDSLSCWWYVGDGDGVQGDPDEEGGEAEHKAGRNIPGFENVIPCEVDDLISEKRRSGRKLGWNNHQG